MSNHEGEPRDEGAGQDRGDAAHPEVERAADEADPALGATVDDAPNDVVADDGGVVAETDTDGQTISATQRHLVRQKAKRVTANQRVRRVVIWVIAALVVLGLLAAAGLWIYRNVVPEVTEPVPQPGNVADGAIPFDGHDLSSMLGDQADAGDEAKTDDESSDEETSDEDEPKRVTVDVYVDYLSPESGLFHQSNAAQLASWVEEGAISLTYHPVALLTAKSNGTEYSQRAMGAVACAASGDLDHVVPFNHALLTDQPEIDSPGFTSDELVAIAEKAGVENPDVGSCIRNDKYAGWARDTTSVLSEGDLPGTDGQALTGAPMILVSGIPYTGALDDPGELSQFVLTVESDEYYESPTPDPSE